MVDAITAAELATYLEREVNPSLTQVAELTNGVISESWMEPIEPVPASVKSLALTVGARALANKTGLSSFTRSWDDMSRTERFGENGEKARVGVYLTDEEVAELNGSVIDSSPVGTIHTPARTWPCS